MNCVCGCFVLSDDAFMKLWTMASPCTMANQEGKNQVARVLRSFYSQDGIENFFKKMAQVSSVLK